MKITAINKSNFAKNDMYNKKVNFGARPQQILQKLDKADICGGKKGMLKNLAEFFIGLEDKLKKSKDLPNKYEYFLTKENKLPKNMANLTPGGTGVNAEATLQEFDEAFMKKTFKCKPDSTCNCGQGKTIGQFASELLAKIGCDEPEKITISK